MDNSDTVIPNPPSPMRLNTVESGLASLTPRPAANEKPTNPKSNGVKRDLGSKKLNSSVA